MFLDNSRLYAVLTQDTSKQTNADASKDLPTFGFSSFKGKGDNESGESDHKERRNKDALVQGKHEFLLSSSVLASDGKVTNNSGNNTSTRDPERKQDESDISVGNGDGSNDGSDKGLEQVSAHT